MFSIIPHRLHFGVVIVGLNYGFPGQTRLDEVTGGAPYGSATIAGSYGSRQPSDNELDAACHQGPEVAEVARKLHG
ncbi:hypothetical protein [Lysobacter antibioticus]|uniref:hypothetical protein n=1 Tax=Lysobacter antibioticus TaxID=84531 RepID=UPI0004D0330D|nr:hypothetical protein [Lysobacter antibioticus]